MRDRIYAVLFRLWYQITNWRAHWRALYYGSQVWANNQTIKAVGKLEQWAAKVSDYRPQLHGYSIYEGTLDAKVIRASGKSIDLGRISNQIVTTSGVNYIRDAFTAHAGSADVQNMKFHDSGTGVTAAAVGDTDLQTAAGPTTRATGTQNNGTSKTYITVGTITYAGTLAITEWILANQATRGAGTVILDHAVFSAINVASGDSIQFTFTLTLPDGG